MGMGNDRFSLSFGWSGLALAIAFGTSMCVWDEDIKDSHDKNTTEPLFDPCFSDTSKPCPNNPRW